MTSLLLVRHADAGDRSTWSGDDLRRPLSPRGREQAAALVGTLGPLLRDASSSPEPRRAAAIHSSPAHRCLATVAPLAAHLSTSVITDHGLFEGAPVGRLLDRLPGITVPTVWASHGDVIPALLMALVRGGLDLGQDPRCRKASTWLLQLAADGGVVAATYVERPAGATPPDGTLGRAPG